MHDDEFVSYLKDVHSGVQSCVSGAVLAKTFRVSENELRRRVNRLRRKGNPIASNRSGYFYAVNAGEVYATVRQLESMDDGLRAAIDGLINSLDGFGGEGK